MIRQRHFWMVGMLAMSLAACSSPDEDMPPGFNGVADACAYSPKIDAQGIVSMVASSMEFLEKLFAGEDVDASCEQQEAMSCE